MTGEEWIKERKSVYKFYRDKFSPELVKNLTKDDISFFLTFRGNESWTNLQRGCKRLANNIERLKNILLYLRDDSIPVIDRLNSVTRGGKLYAKGFGKNLATGLLHLFNWQKYGVWNNRSQKVLSDLNRLPYISSNFGQSYVRLNSEIQKLAGELNTDLVYVDGFLWWLDHHNKINKAQPIKTKYRAEKSSKELHVPTVQELEIARKTFEKYEPRDLFYRASLELVVLSIEEKTSLSVAEALAVLLQTWNQSFYKYRGFDSKHFSDIENIINSHYRILFSFRNRSIESLNDKEEDVIKKIFSNFEKVLGPVGAAKSLHLLAPMFFPLWDRAIANAYKVTLTKSGMNAGKYLSFMRISKEHTIKLGGEKTIGRNALKALDEYNYCKYTKKWI